jgi:hypothetical protein
MARSRRGSPPLFELLDGNRFRRGNTDPQPDLRLVQAEVEADDPRPSRSPARLNDPDAIVETTGPSGGVQLRGDRLWVSLTPVTAAAGVFVLCVLILAAVFFGKKRGEQAAFDRVAGQAGLPGETGGLEALLQQPPATHLIEPLLVGQPAPMSASTAIRPKAPATGAPAAASESVSQGPWVRDHTYIVAQEFAAGREADAAKAQAFLGARGFHAELVFFESGALQLITVEGYDHKDPGQKRKADEILKRQRAAGAEYWATGGGYKLEGYFKTLKKEAW